MELQELLQAVLCPAGDGVFTVSTGSTEKVLFQQQYYEKIKQSEIFSCWQNEIASALSSQLLFVLGIPSDVGGGIQRGANWGPLSVREAMLHYFPHWRADIVDLGDVRVIPQLLLDAYLSSSLLKSCKKFLYADQNSSLPVSPLSIAQMLLMHLYVARPGLRLLTIGGDHSCSYPLVRAYFEHKKNIKKRCALIHIDAHTDLLSSRMGIPICFGSWIYHILPFLPDPACLLQVGIRATQQMREIWEKEYGIKQYWAKDFKAAGIDAILDAILLHLKNQNCEEVYVTVDIDALDSSIASATGTPEKDGLTVEEILTLLKGINRFYPITGCDLMEVAPFVHNSNHLGNKETTLTAAAKIIWELSVCLKNTYISEVL